MNEPNSHEPRPLLRPDSDIAAGSLRTAKKPSTSSNRRVPGAAGTPLPLRTIRPCPCARPRPPFPERPGGFDSHHPPQNPRLSGGTRRMV